MIENSNSPEEPKIEGDTHQPETETNLTEIPFPGTGAPKIKPNGTNILVAWQTPEQVGGIIMPQKMRTLDFITVTVLETGPDVKDVGKGDRIIVASKAIVNGEAGIIVDGFRLFFTQSQLIVARVS